MPPPRTSPTPHRRPRALDHLRVLESRIAHARPPRGPTADATDAALQAVAALAYRAEARSIDGTLTPWQLCVAIDIDDSAPLPVGLTRAHERVLGAFGVPLAIQRGDLITIPGPNDTDDALIAAARLARAYLARIRAFEHESIAATDPEAVHQLRVGIRRLRTVLRLIEHEHTTAAVERTVAAVRRLGDVAGKVRDHDVVIELVAGLEAPTEARNALSQFLETRRASHLQRLRNLLQSEEHDATMRAAEATMQTLEATPIGRSIGDAAHDQVRRFLKRTGRRLHDDLTQAGGYHEVRRALRRLRDTVEVFGDALGKGDRRWRKRMQPIQSLLGALNDTDTALALAARAPRPARASVDAIRRKRLEILVELAAPLAVAAVLVVTD